MILNNASDIQAGTVPTDSAYVGSSLVWERGSPLAEIMVGSGSLVQTFDNYPEMNFFVGQNRDKVFYVLIRSGDAIQNGAFSGLDNVNPVVFQTTIKKIGSYAFSGCKLLQSIDLSAVTRIGSYAFNQCDGMRNVKIFGGVSNIPEAAFYNCAALSSVEIADGVKTIGNRAFRACHVLSSVSLPQSLTSIGEETFEYCYDLETITIPQNVVSIGNNTFHDSGIRTIRINRPSGSIIGSPWGATNATVIWTG